MIDLYTWNTPNGRKVSIMLEEVELPYTVFPVDLGKGEQHQAGFVKISPNHKIPAIVDHDNGLTLMESGAILMYLAKKTGSFLPRSGEEYWRVLEWLMFQMGSLGPLLGQTHHFVRYNPGKSSYAEERYLTENRRLYSVLDKRLGDHEYLVDDYSIADIATWPWIARFDYQTMDLNDYPNLKRWYLEIVKRPAVQTGYYVPARVQEIPMP
ncbi:MAG: glutathione S-transferase N-terminal domain-containing protein [Arenicellales bacterium]|nr:glutathione S-transferase N-terminal domain-containing protein [Arenicellales bacterium]